MRSVALTFVVALSACNPSCDGFGDNTRRSPDDDHPGHCVRCDGGDGDARWSDGGPSAGDARVGCARRTIDLGLAGQFAVLSKAGISTVPNSMIIGDVGVSPAAATYITGFSLVADPTNRWAISAQVTGRVYAANYAPPTPADMTTAVGDMETAYNYAAGCTPDVHELGAGDLSGRVLRSGVYKWGTGVLISTGLTLTGSQTDVWIFQIAQGLTMASGSAVYLAGSARARNVVWQVSESVSLGTSAHLEGVVLTKTSAVLGSGASINGRLLAQTAVTLNANVIVESGP